MRKEFTRTALKQQNIQYVNFENKQEKSLKI